MNIEYEEHIYSVEKNSYDGHWWVVKKHKAALPAQGSIPVGGPYKRKKSAETAMKRMTTNNGQYHI